MTFYPYAFKAAFSVASIFAAGQAIVDHSISLPTAGTVGVIVFGGVWKLSKMLAEENAHTEALKDRVLQFEKSTAEALSRIENRIGNLPCHPKECPKPPE